jgi:hypothetical protein
VVLELPLGTFEDAAAMYRATLHQRPLANGLSGYFPPHYERLRTALDEGRVEVLADLAPERDVAIFVSRQAPGPALGEAILARLPARRLAHTDAHDVLWLMRRDDK